MNKKAMSALHALRSARANGALDQTEVQFLDLIEGLVPEHYPNDPKLSTPRGPELPCGGMTVNYVGSDAGHAVEPNTVYDSSAEHWSPWLEWRGGPCPLPGDVVVEVSFRGEHDDSGIVDEFYWDRRDPNSDIIRFRYRADNPAGWLPRGDWIPPAELWDEGCPVRCEWINAPVDSSAIQREQMTPSTWSLATHVRLVAREAKAGLPEGWEVSPDTRALLMPSGRVPFARIHYDTYGPAVIRQAVDAWLREMGDE